MTEKEWQHATDPLRVLGFLLERTSRRKLRLFAVGCCRRIWDLMDDCARHVVLVAEAYADGAGKVQELDDAQRAMDQALEEQWAATLDRGYPTLVEWQLELFPMMCREGQLSAWKSNHDPDPNLVRACYPYQPEVLRRLIIAGKPFNAARKTADHRMQVLRTGGCSAGVVCANTDAAWARAGVPDEDATVWRQDLAAEYQRQTELLRDIFGNPFRPVAFDPAWRTADVTAVAATIYAERRFADLPILADALEEAGCTSADLLDHCRQPSEHVRGCWAVDLVLEKT